MIRTQISLSRTEYAQAKLVAKALGVSLAELLRRALRGWLPQRAGPAWMRFAGLVESGNSQSSQSIDDVIYGQKD